MCVSDFPFCIYSLSYSQIEFKHYFPSVVTDNPGTIFPSAAFLNISSIVCHPRTAHLIRAGMWETSWRMEASSSGSRSVAFDISFDHLEGRGLRGGVPRLFFPMIRSSIISAEAWEMAQPSPTNARPTISSFSTFNFSQISSPQLGFTPSRTRFASGRS